MGKEKSETTVDQILNRLKNHPIISIVIVIGIVIIAIGEFASALNDVFNFLPTASIPTLSPTPISTLSPTPIPTLSPTPIPVLSPTPISTPLSPHIYNFSACTEPCNGANATQTFTEKTKTISFQWYYENIPINSDYTRIWSMDGVEWVRYECKWPGPISGLDDKVKLSNPDGLQSGRWDLTILINGQIVLKEQVMIEGDWLDWYPPGVIQNCYGFQ